MVSAEAIPMNKGGVDSWTRVTRRMSGAENPIPPTALLSDRIPGISVGFKRMDRHGATHKAVAMFLLVPDIAKPMMAAEEGRGPGQLRESKTPSRKGGPTSEADEAGGERPPQVLGASDICEKRVSANETLVFCRPPGVQ